MQVIGRTLLLYRRHPKKPKIELPVPGKRGSAPAGGASSKPKSKAHARTPAGATEAVDVVTGSTATIQLTEGSVEYSASNLTYQGSLS